MDNRVFYFSPGEWEILRYLAHYETMPIQLLLGAAKATPAELLHLSKDQEMIDAHRYTTDGPRYAGHITKHDIDRNVLVATINGFGKDADNRLRPARQVLGHLANQTTTLGHLTAVVDVTDTTLIDLDQRALITLRRPTDTDKPNPLPVNTTYLRRGGTARTLTTATLTTKGRAYTELW